ncbi:MAG: histidinol dehydrogenase, partial [Bacteroidales bacterium]|nr:histidinol dehydrogenase [Bacteroidales bacterium]
MEIIKYPSREQWPALMRRPLRDTTQLFDQVGTILRDVKANGDAALKNYEARFDGVTLEHLQVTPAEIQAAETFLSEALKQAICQAKKNIEAFHRAQVAGKEDGQLFRIETMPGVQCWQKSLPIDKVGLYIPGGTAPLFSTVLMLAIPAKIAACRDIVLCSPPDRQTGQIHPAVLYAAQLCGVDKIFKLGGVQAIAAMAYGTESVPQVYKIFGPGNQFVTAAKQMVSLEDVAIDMPAGPSEVEVIADESAHPEYVAADLLSQAEHGIDSQVLMITDSEALADAVMTATLEQCKRLPRKDIAEKSLENSRIIVLAHDDLMDFTNEYAPEHLIISTKDYVQMAEQVRNAGSVFLGNYTPESAGDYASGTNHTLPTKACSRAYSGVSVDSFMKKTTFQEISAEALQNDLGPIIRIMAENEQLFA